MLINRTQMIAASETGRQGDIAAEDVPDLVAPAGDETSRTAAAAPDSSGPHHADRRPVRPVRPRDERGPVGRRPGAPGHHPTTGPVPPRHAVRRGPVASGPLASETDGPARP